MLMLNKTQLDSFKHFVTQCNIKRNKSRIKFFQHKHDNLFENGNKVYSACLRFIALVPSLRLVEKYDNRKYAVLALKKLKEFGCYNDLKLLSKHMPLLPDDLILKDEYLSLISVTIKKLKSMEKK